MSRRLEDLDAEYRSLFNKLIEEIIISGVTPLIVFTYRPPVEQAVLWRQSRPEWLVNLTIARLSKGNLLQRKQAEALIKAGPCKGPHVTDALPYESAHQFGYAIDLCPLVDGKADWKNIE
ncbi:MAG: D-alanyl-D-alanine carboxypeptidase family protein, partial [Candidatus Bathyarchaeia archaeon]